METNKVFLEEVRIKCTKEQITKLKEKASLVGLSLTAFCRIVLLDGMEKGIEDIIRL